MEGVWGEGCECGGEWSGKGVYGEECVWRGVVCMYLTADISKLLC